MRSLLILIVLAGLLTYACESQRQVNDELASSSLSQASQGGAEARPSLIPADVTYSILNSQTIPGIKRSIEVRLNKKVSVETLRVIALKLHSEDPADYERTFIGYYLPDMIAGHGAWATTHFNPELKAEILGLSKHDEEELVTEPPPVNHKVIGRWIDESPFVGSRITIFRDAGKLFMERKFKDGGSLKEEMVEQESPLGRRFAQASGSRTDDHWIIVPDGNLQIRDSEGLINVARKVR